MERLYKEFKSGATRSVPDGADYPIGAQVWIVCTTDATRTGYYVRGKNIDGIPMWYRIGYGDYAALAVDDPKISDIKLEHTT